MTTIGKPTLDDTRWALTTGNVDASNSAAAPSGTKDTGWALNAVGVSTYDNFFKNRTHRWHEHQDALTTFGGNGYGIAIAQLDYQNAGEGTLGPLLCTRDFSGNIRSTVDHNGYRMGQVTELDETWWSQSQAMTVPIAAAVVQSGTWVFSTDWTASTSGALWLSLSAGLPNHAIITNVLLTYSKTVAGDSVTFTVQSVKGATTAPGSTNVVKTIATGTGTSTIDLFSAPTSGHGPKMVGFDGVSAGSVQSVDDLQLSIALTLTGSFTLQGISIVYTMPPPAWIYNGNTLGLSATGDDLVLTDPQSGLNQRAVQLLGTAVSASSAPGLSTLQTAAETFLDATTAYVIEFMIKTGVITDGSAHRQFVAGAKLGSADFVALYSDNTFANWQLQVVGSSTTNTDSGVAIAAGTVYRVRVEIDGGSVSSAGAGNFRCRLWINGNKVADVVNTTLPASAKLAPYFSAGTGANTTGGPYDITIGRVRRAWNHLLAGDSL